MIYKIFRAAELAELVALGETPGSPADRADGFVHFSTRAQLPGTALRHFAEEAGLWLLACDEAALGPALVWEPSRGGALFPHLRRPLLRGDVAWIRPFDGAPDPGPEDPSPADPRPMDSRREDP